MFNPIVTSLRGIQQASELKKVQKKLDCPQTSLGSLSEVTEVFDPKPLRQIASELAGQLEPLSNNRQFPEVKHLLTAVDGSVVSTPSNIVQAAHLKSPTDGSSKSAYRLHTHFDIERGVPLRIDVTGGCNSGDGDECGVLKKALEPDHCYVKDRGYAKFSPFNDIHNIGSSYVCRVRENSRYDVVEERALSDKATEAGVVLDAVVLMGQDRQEASRPNHPMRLVIVKTTPHEKRGGSSGVVSDGYLRIATNLLDVPAEVIAFIYQKRWMIEEYHKGMKTGCSIEGMQFTHIDRLEPAIAVISAVTTTLLRLRDTARAADADRRPVAEVVVADYVKVLAAHYGKRLGANASVKKFYRHVARLGGHQNRKRDGFPGWITLWRGWMKLQMMVDGDRATTRKNTTKCGKT